MAEETAPAEAPADEAQPAASTRVDPYRAYNFKLLIDGVSEGHFTECSGLGVRVQALRYREGGDASIVHQLAGPVEYAEVTLRYGLTNTPQLWEWMMKSIEGTPERKNVSIVMQGPGGIGEGLRWNLMDAWPCSWVGAPLDALGREIAIEAMTLCYEGLTRA